MGRKDLLLGYDLQFFVMAYIGAMAGIDLNMLPIFAFSCSVSCLTCVVLCAFIISLLMISRRRQISFSHPTMMNWRDVAENPTMQKIRRIVVILIYMIIVVTIIFHREKIYCCIEKYEIAENSDQVL